MGHPTAHRSGPRRPEGSRTLSPEPPSLGPAATLVLVRHGESTWNARGRFQGRRNPWLTERGRAQATAVARRLAEPAAPPALPVPAGPPVAIWHSPLKRATDTARAIGELVPADLHGDARLTEISQGEWETRSQRAVAALGPALAGWRADPVTTIAPGGEPLAAVRRRVRAALRDILTALVSTASPSSQTPSSSTPTPSSPTASAPTTRPWGVIVSHEGTLRVATLLLLGLPLARFWAFPFEAGAITVIDVNAGQAVLRAHNLVSHLADLGGAPAPDRRGAL